MIELTQECLKQILNYNPETGVFIWKIKPAQNIKVGQQAGCLNKNGYIQISILNKRYYAHRLAWLYTYGSFPTEHIDHVNGVRNDNRIKNIRVANRFENAQNSTKKKNNSSGYKGVNWDTARNKWRAKIMINGKSTHIGIFDKPEDAAKAYDVAAQQAHGSFARLNFPANGGNLWRLI